EKFIESHTGISCSACHSVVHVKSTMGNGDYVTHYPPMHKYVISDNPLLKATTKFLTRLSPDPHRKTFLKPFHTQDTAKFCSSCHKVHLDIPVNNFRWFRGFNDYDAWQASGVSGQGARSFYYPSKDGKPDFKKCVDCHMPLVRSNDAGNKNGFVKSHRFLAANTALPYVYHDREQLELTQKFLRDGALTIDIFALRRKQKGVVSAPKPGIQRARSAQPDQPQAANLFGEVATTGHAGSLITGSLEDVRETVIAPLDRGPVAVRRGEDVLIEVVVRTRKVGHAFPGGTFDAFDVWVELQARDEKGKTLFWSGCLQWPDGPVEKSAHQYRALLVDGASNEINKRNAWAARARIYARAIPPGAADTVHYRLRIPKECGNRITLTAKLNYRKFSWYNTHFAFAGRPVMDGDPNYSKGGIIQGTALGKDASGRSKTGGPVTVHYDNRPFRFDADMKVVAAKDTSRIPNLPITVLCENTVTLNVTDGNPEAATAPRKLDVKKDRERWNDYGIGLMLQGDFRRATEAFKKVTELSPEWPEGYVNIGRVRLLEGDNAEARAMLEKALAMYNANTAAVPPAMIPYLRARTQFFYGVALKNLGQYDRALAEWSEAARVFPNDRELRNQMGRVHFLSARFDQAIAEFQHVLTIDPEDLTAHYNLMLCYRGKGPAFKVHEQRHQTLYYRFKADETTTHLQGPYKRRNPEDNLESQPVHEHHSAKPPLPGPPEIVRQLLPKAAEVSKPVRKAENQSRRG
ncbi:MAG TPA: tetratricopeptide repeat protein, partial [Chthonomonadales bacterium]|nr:tetratricopeptide repeat protein [Chthonomonadales bacterium]